MSATQVCTRHMTVSLVAPTCRLANPLQRPLSERRKVNPMTEMTQKRFRWASVHATNRGIA